MLDESVANDKAQWNGRPLGMYKTLKHGSDCTSWVVLSNAGPVVPSCLKIALWAHPLSNRFIRLKPHFLRDAVEYHSETAETRQRSRCLFLNRPPRSDIGL